MPPLTGLAQRFIRLRHQSRAGKCDRLSTVQERLIQVM